MAREEVGRRGGIIAMVSVLAIMVILLAVVALVVVNALKHSPWGAFTIAATIPIAMLMGVYMRFLRPGRVLEASGDRLRAPARRRGRRPVGRALAGVGAGLHAHRSRARASR